MGSREQYFLQTYYMPNSVWAGGCEKMEDPHKMKTIFSWKICGPSVGFLHMVPQKFGPAYVG